MSVRVVTTSVMGELVNVDDSEKAYTAELNLSINQYTPEEQSLPAKQWVIRHELAANSNGTYVLRYVFNGQQQQHRVRVRGNRLLMP